MRLIAAEKRNKYRCAICGKQPAKYFINGVIPFTDYANHEYSLCSLCALKYSTDEHEYNTFMEDEQR